MTDDVNLRLAELKEQKQTREQLTRYHGKVRDELVQMGYRMQAFEVYLEQAKSDVSKLESLSLENLVFSLLGGKEKRLIQRRQKCEELQEEHEECTKALSALEREVADLQQQIEDVDDPTAEYDSLLASKLAKIEAGGCDGSDERSVRLARLCEELSAARDTVEEIRKAREAGKRARADLADEVGVLSKLGNCRVAEGCAQISWLMNKSRNNSAEQCASRVRASIGRFGRKLDDVISRLGDEAGAELVEVRGKIEHIARELTAVWLVRTGPNGETGEHVQEWLGKADMLLERQFDTSGQRAAALEDEREVFIATV